MTRPNNKDEPLLAVAETARRLGVTARALRLYERKGLVTPRRTAAGWRVYGAAVLERLHQVLALKSLGLTLAQIGELLAGSAALDDVLAAQESALIATRDRADRGLALLRRARARIAEGRRLSADDLIELTRQTAMTDFAWTDEHDALARRHFSAEQLKALGARKLDPQTQEQTTKVWTALIAEAESLRDGPPDAPQALDLARRWCAQAKLFTQGDRAVETATADWYRDGFSSPETAKLMPFSREVWEFMGKAGEALKRSEGSGA